MNLIPEFRDQSLAQGSVSKYIDAPGKNSWKDGGFLGQCVSEINQYCWRVLDVPAGIWGNAISWAKPDHPFVTQYFDHVSSPQLGDIGVLGAPYGLQPDGTYAGHIFIYLSATQILEQNGRIALTVTLSSPYKNPIAILRRKGGSPSGDPMKPNREQVLSLCKDYWGADQPPTEAEITHFMTIEWYPLTLALGGNNPKHQAFIHQGDHPNAEQITKAFMDNLGFAPSQADIDHFHNVGWYPLHNAVDAHDNLQHADYMKKVFGGEEFEPVTEELFKKKKEV